MKRGRKLISLVVLSYETSPARFMPEKNFPNSRWLCCVCDSKWWHKSRHRLHSKEKYSLPFPLYETFPPSLHPVDVQHIFNQHLLRSLSDSPIRNLFPVPADDDDASAANMLFDVLIELSIRVSIFSFFCSRPPRVAGRWKLIRVKWKLNSFQLHFRLTWSGAAQKLP